MTAVRSDLLAHVEQWDQPVEVKLVLVVVVGGHVADHVRQQRVVEVVVDTSDHALHVAARAGVVWWLHIGVRNETRNER